MSNFLESGPSRETSKELIEAIWEVARHDEASAERIWDEPTADEAIAIWEIVTKNGLRNSSDYAWGASGYSWAQDLGVEAAA